MRTIQELAGSPKEVGENREISELAAETTATDAATLITGDTNLTSFRLTQFSDEIYRIGQDFRFLQNVCNHNTKLVGTRDYGVRLFNESAVLAITQTHTETDVRTFTEMTNLGYIDAAVVFKMGAIVISKEIASTAHVDLVEEAKYLIAQGTEKDIEDSIITELTLASTTEVFGGDATTLGTLETGDVMTPDVIADARTALREINAVPAALLVHPIQEGALVKDTQFTNASEYGGREVILNGEIGKYLGTKTIVTTNIAATASGTTGKQCFMLGKNSRGQWPVTLVWKEKPHYDYEYLKRRNAHYIYVDAAYDVEIIWDAAVCEIAVTNA